MIARLGFWLLDRADRLHREPCEKYGGTLSDGRVRLCTKLRWHTDSHTFAPPSSNEESE